VIRQVNVVAGTGILPGGSLAERAPSLSRRTANVKTNPRVLGRSYAVRLV
jgi:hypothetical protein